MKLIDMIALAKAGYTKRDIEKIRAEELEEVNEGADESEASIITEEEAGSIPDTDPEEVQPDFRELYESAMKTIKAQTDEISRLQKANMSRDISGEQKDIYQLAQDSLNALI